MSEFTYTTREPETAGLRRRLCHLRRQVANWIWIEGLARVLWLVLGLAAVDFALDWLFWLDRSQRTIVLALMLAGLAIASYRWLVRPLSYGASDDALALRLEAAHPNLGQSLISALQLARVSDVQGNGMSPALVRQVIASGLQRAQEISFASVLDRRRYAHNALLLFAACAVFSLGAIGTIANSSLNIWLRRNVLLGSAMWPQKTYLVIEGIGPTGGVVFPKDADWKQVVSVTQDSAVVPDTVYLDVRQPGAGDTGLRPMKKSATRAFETTFTNVNVPFEFRARGGDAVTDWTQVVLVASPEITELRLVLALPEYTGKAPETLAPGRGPYWALPGSSLRLEGATNKEVKRAALTIEGKPLGPQGEERFGSVAIGNTVVPLAVDSSGKFARGLAADELLAGHYRFELEDLHGFRNRESTSFAISKQLDREPRVQARLIGIGGMVVPEARIPYACRVLDDYGITKLSVGYHWNTMDGVGGEGESAVTIADSANRPAGELAVDEVFQLAPLKLPIGAGLSIRFEAADNDIISGPNVGRSAEFLVRIVSREELRADLLRREIEQRHELERLLREQEDLLTDSRAAAADAKSRSNFNADQKDQLAQNARRQKVVGQGVSLVAERLAEMAVEVENNRLESAGGPVQKRLSQEIVGPLRAVAGSLIPRSAEALTQSRRKAELSADRDRELAAAISAQSESAAQLKQVLEHMVKSEGFQEVVNLLYEIHEAQAAIAEQTEEARQERVKRLLDGGRP